MQTPRFSAFKTAFWLFIGLLSYGVSWSSGAMIVLSFVLPLFILLASIVWLVWRNA